MSVNYSMVERHNPQDVLKKLWYPQLEMKGLSTMSEIARRVSYATTITEADLVASFRAVMREIKSDLIGGNHVDLDEFGIFSMQLRARGVLLREDFSVANIKSAFIHFRPKKAFQIDPYELDYYRVPQRKDIEALLK